MTIEQLSFTDPNSKNHNTMVVLVDDEMLGKYRNHEEGVTVNHVVDSFDIFKFESGKQGNLLRPSKSELQATFGTTDADECVKFMLDKGHLPTHRGKKGGHHDDEARDGPSRLHVPRSGRPL